MAIKGILFDYFGVIHIGSKDEELIELINNLSNKYSICILSNSASKHLDLDGLSFEPEIVTPQDVGSIKPQSKIYEYTLERMKLKPEEAIFIDDSEINVLAANQLGINGLLYDNIYKLSKDLADLGVKL